MKTIKILLTLTTAFLLLNAGCKKDSPTEPTPTKSPGYQEDIPWLSLADSPWAMYRADPQNTGRSKYAGPTLGIIEKTIDSLVPASSIAVDNNLSIYFIDAVGGPGDYSGAIAFDDMLNVKWYLKNERILLSSNNPSSPLVNNEGTMFYSIPLDKKFFAINRDGSTKWVLNNLKIVQTGINIGKDGTIYVVALNDSVGQWELTAISSQGELLWSLPGLGVLGDALNSMSFSPDGQTLYISGNLNETSVNAIDIVAKTKKWSFGKDRLIYNSAPIVDSEGNIYTLTYHDESVTNLYSLTPDGNIRWKYTLDTAYFVNDMNPGAIDKNGNLYYGDKNIMVIDYKGKLVWRDSINGRISSPITIDNQNNIFFSVANGTSISFLCYSDKGVKKWEVLLGNNFSNRGTNFSPAIIGNYRLLFPTYRNNFIFVIK